MKIKVTKEHIEKGIPRNSTCCPIGRALEGKIGEVYGVCVKEGRAVLRLDNRSAISHILLDLPTVCTTFMNNFDLGFPVKPFTFELAVS